jgi:hypothetical protein
MAETTDRLTELRDLLAAKRGYWNDEQGATKTELLTVLPIASTVGIQTFLLA